MIELDFSEVEGRLGAEHKEAFQLPGQNRYRLSRLEEAAERLERIIENGSPSQQRAARRLLSDIATAQGRERTREAFDRWAEVQVKSATVLSHLLALQKAHHREASFDDDTSELIEGFRDAQQDQQRRLESRRKELAALESRLADLDQEIEDFEARQSQALERSNALFQAALEEEGDGRYDKEIESIQARRAADAAAAEVEKRSVRREVLLSEKRVLERQIELAGEAIEELESNMEEARKRAQVRRESREKAGEEVAEAADRLLESYQAIYQSFNQQVHEPVASEVVGRDPGAEGQSPEALMARAIHVLGPAVEKSRGEEAASFRLERVFKHVGRVRVMTDLAVIRQAFGQALREIETQGAALLPEYEELFSDNQELFAQTQAAWVSRTEEAIGQAMEDATKIGDGLSEDHPLAESARSQRALLEGYTERLIEATNN